MGRQLRQHNVVLAFGSLRLIKVPGPAWIRPGPVSYGWPGPGGNWPDATSAHGSANRRASENFILNVALAASRVRTSPALRRSAPPPLAGLVASPVVRFTPDQVASPLARRPYDLRHAAVSLWPNAGVHAPEVAERVGHGADVLLKVYAKRIDGQHEAANKRSWKRSRRDISGNGTDRTPVALGVLCRVGSRTLGIVPRASGTPVLTWGNAGGPIPRIFRDHWQAAAFDCIQLHVPVKIGKNEGPGQGLSSCSRVVGRLGLEPRTYGLKVRSSNH